MRFSNEGSPSVIGKTEKGCYDYGVQAKPIKVKGQ
jgi:hypothetical protein